VTKVRVPNEGKLKGKYQRGDLGQGLEDSGMKRHRILAITPVIYSAKMMIQLWR
jgi:hypothetical protein